MKKELDNALCAKFPKIFRDRHASGVDTCIHRGFECDDGWYRLIDNLCGCIQSYLDANCENNQAMQVVAVQLKEKLGTLHFYYRGGDELIAGMVWFAEYLSSSICEVCGEPGQIRRRGWISVLCDRHAGDSDASVNEEMP